MFLIQISEYSFVDGEKINWINVDHKGSVIFTLEGDVETTYATKGKYSDILINNIGALNSNSGNIGTVYRELKEEENK